MKERKNIGTVFYTSYYLEVEYTCPSLNLGWSCILLWPKLVSLKVVPISVSGTTFLFFPSNWAASPIPTCPSVCQSLFQFCLLPSIVNIAARIFFLKYRSHLEAPLLTIFQWLPIALRIKSRPLTMVQKALYNLVPAYLFVFISHNLPLYSWHSYHTRLLCQLKAFALAVHHPPTWITLISHLSRLFSSSFRSHLSISSGLIFHHIALFHSLHGT